MKIKDERLMQAKTKIHSELFIITYYAVLISFVVKSLVLQMDLSQCLLEFILLVGTPVYQSVRSRQMGVVLITGDKKKQHKNMAGHKLNRK